MRENRLYGSAGGGARERSPYPHRGFVAGPAAGSDQSQLVPAELERIVIGGRSQRLAGANPQPDQQFQFRVH